MNGAGIGPTYVQKAKSTLRGGHKTGNSHRSFELRWLFLRLILLCDKMEQNNKSDYISARLPSKNRLLFSLRKLGKKY